MVQLTLIFSCNSQDNVSILIFWLLFTEHILFISFNRVIINSFTIFPFCSLYFKEIKKSKNYYEHFILQVLSQNAINLDFLYLVCFLTNVQFK